MSFFRHTFASRLVVAMALIFSLQACASRPTEEILKPVAVADSSERKITILSATNRNLSAKSDDPVDMRSDKLTFEAFRFSIPKQRPTVGVVYPKPSPDPRKQFLVTERDPLDRPEFLRELELSVDESGTIAVFVHGYNYSYQEAVYWTAQLGADAGNVPPPVLFAWPSQGSLTGYVADRDEALASRTELTRLLELVSRARGVKHIVLFAHSMGSLIAIEAVRQLQLEERQDVSHKLEIYLAAADIDVDLFRSQLADIGRLPHPITLLVSKQDRALSFSSLLGQERPRVGQADVHDPRIATIARDMNLRIFDITALKDSDGLGHDRYASLAKSSEELIQAERSPAAPGHVGVIVFTAANKLLLDPIRVISASHQRAGMQ